MQEHQSDCATNNEPAMPNGACDCVAVKVAASYKPDVCIYHAGCDDGFGAAWAVWRRWGDGVQYIPLSYGQPLPDGLDDKHILFVDFSLKQNAMRALGTFAASVVVLDHHKTAEAELEPFVVSYCNAAATKMMPSFVDLLPKLIADNEEEETVSIFAVFDMDKSGARLAWEFCHPGEPLPEMLALIEDRDLWRFARPGTREVIAALQTYPRDFTVWNSFAWGGQHGVLGTEGTAILRGNNQTVQALLKTRYWDKVAGVLVPVVNAPYLFASDLGHALLDAEPTAPFVATWFRRADGKVQYSLRSTDDRADVSEIAKALGCGGHRNAAGFEVTPVVDCPGSQDGEEQIKHMVDRFLSWELPETFNPDGGIKFERFGSAGTPLEYRRQPVGTNLFSATEAAAMVRHMLEGLPIAQTTQHQILKLEERERIAVGALSRIATGRIGDGWATPKLQWGVCRDIAHDALNDLGFKLPKVEIGDEPAKPIEVGKVMRLKSGGPAMVVYSFGKRDDDIEVAGCVWTNEAGEGQTYDFPLVCLIPH